MLNRTEPLVVRFEILLGWLVVWWYGAFCLSGAVIHYQMALTESSPVPPHVHFEYVFANIGLGVLAVLTVFFRGSFLIGAVSACAIFYIGAAIWDVIALVNTQGAISGDL